MKDSGNSENEKKDVCGQSSLVGTKNIVKVKKMADFIRNQPLFLATYDNNDTVSYGFKRFHLKMKP